jgi:CheY-like chemotaxis protein
MTMNDPSILIVEDDSLIALHLQELLQNAGYDVPDPVASGEEAIEYVRTSPLPDLILMDITLDGRLNGIETARQIEKISYIPVIFISAHSDMELLASQGKSAPTAFIAKPFIRDDILQKVEKMLHR